MARSSFVRGFTPHPTPHTRHPTPWIKRSQTKPENSSGLLLSLINDFYLPGNPHAMDSLL
ncbi:MAG: hypothetical protein F6J93_16250 [Oscillatoria sp. SIO1A7]|nr:hypothetical protein [Oscillatoria sp. SIO1A7]